MFFLSADCSTITYGRRRKVRKNAREISWIFPGHFLDFFWSCPGNIPEISWIFFQIVPVNVQETSGKFPGIFPEISRKLPGNFPEFSRKFPGIFPEITRNSTHNVSLCLFIFLVSCVSRSQCCRLTAPLVSAEHDLLTFNVFNRYFDVLR